MLEYALVGTPNSGKTTIFNALTDQKEKVGNWHGVTASIKKGVYKSKNATFSVVDLPGIYSLSPYSCEEKVSVDYLKKADYEAIILVIDASSPYGGRKLLQELLLINKKIILLFNKVKRADIDREKLLREVSFCEINPYSKKSVSSFSQSLKNQQGVTSLFSLECFKQKNKIFYDRYLLKWQILFPLMVLLISFVYFVAFSSYLGGGLSKLLTLGIEQINLIIVGRVKGWFISCVIEKTVNGLSGVISLIPQVVILQTGLFLLEESGLSCRLCVIGYRALSKLGLSGKSLFPLFSSLGCTAVCPKLCNSCENERVKNNTLNLLAFSPCSAKNSVVIFICLKSFSRPILAMGVAYFSLAILAIIFAFLSQKITKTKSESMFIELVDLSLPSFKRLVAEVIDCVANFFKKIISACAIVSFALAIFTSVTPKFTFAENLQSSLICFLCKKISFVFIPLGIVEWEVVLSLVLGIFAKESIISSLCSLNEEVNFGFYTAIILLYFVLIYSPCLTSLVAFGKEKKLLGFKIFIRHWIFAYLGGIYLRFLLTKPLLFCIITLIIVGVFIFYERVYIAKKRKTNANFVKRRVKFFRNKKTL